MSLFSVGLFLLGGAVGMLIGAAVGAGLGYDYGKREAFAQIRKRLKALQREAWES